MTNFLPSYVLILIYALMAWSNWLPLAAGQLYFGAPAAIAIGGYASAKVASDGGAVKLVEGYALAMLLGATFGALMGLLSMRLVGYGYAIATTGVAAGTQVIISNLNFLHGAQGLSVSPLSDDASAEIGSVAVLVVLLILTFVYRGRFGRRLDLLKGDELLYGAVGLSTSWAKLLVMLASGALGGLSGALYAGYIGFIDPTQFGLQLILNIFGMLVIGGMTSHFGPLLGAVFFVVVIDKLSFAEQYRLVVFAVILLVVLRVRRSGILRKSVWLQRHRVKRMVWSAQRNKPTELAASS